MRRRPGEDPEARERQLRIRRGFLLTGYGVATLLVLARAFQLQALEGAQWAERAMDQQRERISLPALRGTIFDRDSVPPRSGILVGQIRAGRLDVLSRRRRDEHQREAGKKSAPRGAYRLLSKHVFDLLLHSFVKKLGIGSQPVPSSGDIRRAFTRTHSWQRIWRTRLNRHCAASMAQQRASNIKLKGVSAARRK